MKPESSLPSLSLQPGSHNPRALQLPVQRPPLQNAAKSVPPAGKGGRRASSASANRLPKRLPAPGRRARIRRPAAAVAVVAAAAREEEAIAAVQPPKAALLPVPIDLTARAAKAEEAVTVPHAAGARSNANGGRDQSARRATAPPALAVPPSRKNPLPPSRSSSAG